MMKREVTSSPELNSCCNIESMMKTVTLDESFFSSDDTQPAENSVSDFTFSPDRFSRASPWNHVIPLHMSPSESYPAAFQSHAEQRCNYPGSSCYRCITSMNKPDGHIFSLAIERGLLYTGSESKTIRVWRCPDFVEYSRFSSGSGTVKALLLTADKIFSAHYDHKIRVWRRSGAVPTVHRRVATLLTFVDHVQNLMKSHASVKHVDVVSSLLAYNASDDLLYSGSWDKTVKVWRMSDFKCLETVKAHNDVVNDVAVGNDWFLFTRSDDNTVKGVEKCSRTKCAYVGNDASCPKFSSKIHGLSRDGSVLYARCSDGNIHFEENRKITVTQNDHNIMNNLNGIDGVVDAKHPMKRKGKTRRW